MSSSDSRPPTDYRRHRRQTEHRLAVAVVLFLLVVGSGLIAIIYGPAAGVSGFGCLLLGVGAIVLLWILLMLIERWVGD
jgi:protein-S-isoprenylcysteine O-methyltransferase Ste14